MLYLGFLKVRTWVGNPLGRIPAMLYQGFQIECDFLHVLQEFPLKTQ